MGGLCHGVNGRLSAEACYAGQPIITTARATMEDGPSGFDDPRLGPRTTPPLFHHRWDGPANDA